MIAVTVNVSIETFYSDTMGYMSVWVRSKEMLNMRQKEEICCTCHYSESRSKPISEFMQQKSVSETG